MKTAEAKPASVASSQRVNRPFFPKEADGSFFGKHESKEPYFFKPASAYRINRNGLLQTKLTIGQPGDRYEKEADATADKVVQKLSEPGIQREGVSPGENISPLIQQKCAHCEEEEKKKKEDNPAGKQIRRKPIFDSDAEPPDDDRHIQRKCATCEKEEKLQKKSDTTPSSSPSNIESTLNSSKGSGSSLPKSTQSQMESAFGTDFSHVRIHTNSSAIQMNKDLHAQAFTHGSDIYFNSGKYDTNSTGGKHLLAHELTHVVQQSPGIQRQQTPQIQRDPATEEERNRIRDSLLSLGVAVDDPDIQAIHDQFPNGFSQNSQTVFVQVSGTNYSSLARMSAVRIAPAVPIEAQIELFIFRVGKGRAILVSSVGGQSILLDAGAGSAVRSGSTAARVLATHVNNLATSGLAAAPSSIRISHLDADHFNAVSTVLNLPQMGSAVVEITRQQLSQAIAQGNWATMNVQIAPGQRIVQLNVSGTGLDVRLSIIGNMEITEFRSAAAHTSLVTSGQNRFNKNSTSPVTVIRDRVSNTTYITTADAPGRLLNDVVNMVGEDAFRRIAGGGARNLAGVEFPHHGGAVNAGADVTGMVRFLRLMFESSNGTVNFFTQTSASFSGSASASIRYLDTADINVERITEDPTGTTSVRNMRGRANRTITLNGNQISNMFTIANTTSTRVMEAYQMRDRMLNATEQMILMERAFGMAPGETDRLTGALNSARTETSNRQANLGNRLTAYWTELANAAQATGMRATTPTVQLQAELSNLQATVAGINMNEIENSIANIRAGMSLINRVFLNSLSMLYALRIRDLSRLNQLKGEQAGLVEEILRGATRQMGATEVNRQINEAWRTISSNWNERYVQRVAMRMAISEANSREILLGTVLAQNLSRQMQLNELARRAEEGSLPRAPGSVTPMRSRIGAGFMAAIELFRIGVEFYDSWERAEEADAERARTNRIQGLREVYWWTNLGVRPEIRLIGRSWGSYTTLDTTSEEAYRVVNEETPESQRPEYEKVVVYDVSDDDLQTVVAQFYLRFMTIEDWVEAMGDPELNDRRTVSSSNRWFLKSDDGWRVKLWDNSDNIYKLAYKSVIQQPLNDLMVRLETGQEGAFRRLLTDDESGSTFTIEDTAWIFGTDRNAFVYNSYGNPQEIDFENFSPTFVKIGQTEFAFRVRGTMDIVRAADMETYRRLRRYYWVVEGEEYMDASGTHREYLIEENAAGKALVDESHLVRQNTVVSRKASDSLSVSPDTDFESQLISTKNQGTSLPISTLHSMEQIFGYDFDNVRVHNDRSAEEMTTELHAHAFTHGSDIYFNSRKYDTNSTGGKHLLAHELTHVVQQGGGDHPIQRKPFGNTIHFDSLPGSPPKVRFSGPFNDIAISQELYGNPSGIINHESDFSVVSIDMTALLPQWKPYFDRQQQLDGSLGESQAANAALFALAKVLMTNASGTVGTLRSLYNNGIAEIITQRAAMVRQILPLTQAEQVITDLGSNLEKSVMVGILKQHLTSAQAESMAETLATMRHDLAINVRKTGGAMLEKGAELIDTLRGQGRPDYEALVATGRSDAEIILSATKSNEFVNGLPKRMKIAGGVLTVASIAFSVYLVLSTDPANREKVIKEEAGGLAGGLLGSEIGTAICIAAGIASGGLALVACGLIGGVAGSMIGRNPYGLLQMLDIAPHESEQAQGTLYRLQGSIEEIDLLITSIPTKTASENDHALVIATGMVSGELISGRGHYRKYQVIAVNASAEKILETKEPAYVPNFALAPYSQEDLKHE